MMFESTCWRNSCYPLTTNLTIGQLWLFRKTINTSGLLYIGKAFTWVDNLRRESPEMVTDWPNLKSKLIGRFANITPGLFQCFKVRGGRYLGNGKGCIDNMNFDHIKWRPLEILFSFFSGCRYVGPVHSSVHRRRQHRLSDWTLHLSCWAAFKQVQVEQPTGLNVFILLG